MSERDILDIRAIIAGGDGIARRDDGCTVFVPRTVPGERVEVEYTEVRKQFRRGRAAAVVQAGTDRRDAPCPLYERCGACQLQHMTYDAQLRAKTGIIVESFERIGSFQSPPFDIEPSPRELGYRNRVSFVLRRSGNRVAAGYHALNDPDDIVDVDHCPLAEPRLNEAWVELRAAWGEGAALLPAGRELRMTLRANGEGQVGLAIEGGRDPGAPKQIVEKVHGLVSLWSLDRRGNVARYAGAETLPDTWGLYEIPLAGAAFVQVNREVAATMERYTREQLGPAEGKRVIDAYCGFGLMGIDLALEGARVTGIELDRHAVATASHLASEARANVRFLRGPVEKLLARQLPADLVILNPPRRGVVEVVTTALSAKPPERIVYISCNPATLARDIKRLSSRFRLTACRAFDLFPQTAHVETVVTLQRT